MREKKESDGLKRIKLIELDKIFFNNLMTPLPKKNVRSLEEDIYDIVATAKVPADVGYMSLFDYCTTDGDDEGTILAEKIIKHTKRLLSTKPKKKKI